MNFFRNRYIIFVGALFFLTVMMLGLGSLPLTIKSKFTSNKIMRQFLPLYRSFRKLPDVVFLPYLLYQNDLPQINLAIATDDIFYLNGKLPNSSPFTSISLEENRVFVKALFQAGNYSADVETRYKGLNSNHWNSFKKSYRVKFPQENLFERASSLSLVIPEDKLYYAELLNMYRADKFGLLTPNMRLENLHINNQNHGVYLVSDHWSPEFLTKKNVPLDSDLFGVNDSSPELLGNDNEVDYESVVSLFKVESIAGWKSYVEEKDHYEKLEELIELIDHASPKVFEERAPFLIDMEKFYKWDILNILAGNRQQDFENLLMLLNGETGKFEMVPIDIVVNFTQNGYKENSTISKRILAIDKFRERRNELLREYIENEDNLADDLAFYDDLHQTAKVAFFQDHAKKDNNFVFLKAVRDIRQIFIDNFYNAKNVLDIHY